MPLGNAAGLIDFGQSKQLSEQQRLAFARLVLALSAAEGAELLQVVSALTQEQQQLISKVHIITSHVTLRLIT